MNRGKRMWRKYGVLRRALCKVYVETSEKKWKKRLFKIKNGIIWLLLLLLICALLPRVTQKRFHYTSSSTSLSPPPPVLLLLLLHMLCSNQIMKKQTKNCIGNMFAQYIYHQLPCIYMGQIGNYGILCAAVFRVAYNNVFLMVRNLYQ